MAELSAGAPITAVSPLPESAALLPNCPLPSSPVPWCAHSPVQSATSSVCSDHVAPDAAKIHTAPLRLLSISPLISAVVPSVERATCEPKKPWPISPVPSCAHSLVQLPTNFGFAVQVDPERLKTQAAPLASLSSSAPISAVLPSPESATPPPNLPNSLSPLPSLGHSPVQSPTSLACSVQLDPERVNTQAAPASSLNGAPATSVLPSEERATPVPRPPVVPSPVPWLAHSLVQSATSFVCWVQLDPERVNIHTAPLKEGFVGVGADGSRVAVG